MTVIGCGVNDITVSEDVLEITDEVVMEADTETDVETLEEPVYMTGICIDVTNLKTDYVRGETIDFSGLKVYLQYSDTTEEELSNVDYTVSTIDTSVCGTYDVFVQYEDFTEGFEVHVTYQVQDVDDKVQYSSTSLNLRSGPGTEFEKVTSVELNDELIVTGEVDNGWVRVLYNDAEYFCSSKYLMDEKKEIKSASPYDNFVTGEPGSSQDVINSANAYWNSTVPNWLKQKFVEDGWHITISATPLMNRFGYSMSVAGLTNWDTNVIYIDNRISPIKRAILHELGHYIDECYGFPSQTSEFAEIYNAEKYNFVDCTAVGDGHEQSSTVEYFASVFHNAIINGTNCQAQAPRSYEYVCRYMH